jgi:hypothetical protein
MKAMCALLGVTLLVVPTAAQKVEAPSPESLIDAYMDSRWSPQPGDTQQLVSSLAKRGLGLADIERLLRGPRASYPEVAVPKGRIVPDQKLVCEHVDYTTVYHLYLPKSYDHGKAHPLVLVGHGGNGAMSRERASRTALMYLRFWEAAAEKHGVIVVAPATARGWGAYGNSVLFSCISLLQRRFNVDPDRIYATGQSMGGHMSWRCGIVFPDRFGAVGPQSGGYDYVERKNVYNLFNIPGYATHGKREPYGIADYNRKIKAWMEKRGYPWRIVEKDGGHTIYRDEIDKQFTFFLKHPRDLYREQVYVRLGGRLRYDKKEKLRPGWDRDHKWNPARPIRYDTVHWVRLFPREDPKIRQLAWLKRKGQRIEVTAQDVAKLRILLHPRMIDLDRPIEVVVNGASTRHEVRPDPVAMLERARAFDDRGRIFHAHIDLDVPSSKEVPAPTFEAP